MSSKSTKSLREEVLQSGSLSRRNAALPSVPVSTDERRIVHDILHGLGHDPAGVRVCRDAVAAASQGAQAFTSGDDVVLGGAAPAIDGPEGVRLLAHELVHVAQFHEARRQGQAPSGRSQATDPAERQAERMADEIVTHGRVSEHPLVPATAAVHAQDLSPTASAAAGTGPAAAPPAAVPTAATTTGAGATDTTVATAPTTVTANATEVVPTGAPGTNSTTLTITGTPATAYSIAVTATESRGHSHTGTTRPLGVVNPTTVTTGSNGTATATYTSPIVAGTEHITVKRAGQPNAPEAALDITVRVAGLTSLGAGTGYGLIGQTGTHPDNHYGTAGAIGAYQAVGTSWAAIPGTITQLVQPIQAARGQPNAPAPPADGTALTNEQLATRLLGPTQVALEALSNAQLAQVLQAVQNWPTLGYNDMSLEWGGMLDINASWAPPHSTHRVGTNMDFRLSNMGPLHRLVVESLMTSHSINVFHENAAHWHLTAT